MASGIKSKGVDFDDLFDPDIIGDGPTAPNLRSNNTPLRYAALKYGTKRADVGIDENGVDVSNKWAAKGTAVYKLGFDGRTFSAGNQAKTNSSGSATATATLLMNSNGTWTGTATATGGGNNSSTQLATGTWIDAGGSASQYTIQFEQVGGATPVSGLGTFALTASRSVSLSVSVPSESVDNRSGSGSVRATLRRNGVVLRTAVFTLSASAAGWI